MKTLVNDPQSLPRRAAPFPESRPRCQTAANQPHASTRSRRLNIIAVYLWNSGGSYGRHPIFLTDAQRETGSLTLPAGLLKKTGTLHVWLIGEHPLGRLKLRKDIRLIP